MLAQIKKESRIAIVVLFAAILNLGNARANANLTVQISELGFYALELNGQFFDFNQNVYTLPNLNPGMYHVRLHKWIQSSENQWFWHVLFDNLVQVMHMHNTILVYSAWTGITVQHHPMMPPPVPYNPNPTPGNPGMPGYGFHFGMEPNAFSHFIGQLDQMSFDSNKVEFAKFAIRQNGITVAQLISALHKFSFDSNRLDLAMYAYEYSVDRQNYFMLQSAFTFESNFRKLIQSI